MISWALEAIHAKCVEWQGIYSRADNKGTRNHAASKLSAFNECIDILANLPALDSQPDITRETLNAMWNEACMRGPSAELPTTDSNAGRFISAILLSLQGGE